MRRFMTALAVLLAAPVLGLLAPGPAHAAARVSVTGPAGAATIAVDAATTLTVRGNGFQSVRNGHGGIYVFFGTVSGGWRPSQGGVTGRDYLYVPDSETRDNAGHQRYVSFPGSDTAASANGGTMNDAGAWSTTLVVPGPTFRAYDRAGNVQTVDCREVTCGVITVGAHGVANARNETFTPVAVTPVTMGAGAAPAATPTAGSTESPTEPSATAAEPAGDGKEPRATGTAELEVDRPSAVAGHVLAFSATGLEPGSQVSAVLDDGVAGAGPFVVGADGDLAGVITLPADLAAGTHELRLYGGADPPSVRFAVAAQAGSSSEDSDVSTVAASERQELAPELFAIGAGLVLLLALVRLLVQQRRRRGDARAV